MTPRVLFAALICLAASGCAAGDGFFGPPFIWVEDQAAAKPGMRADGYPGEPTAIDVVPDFPL